MAASVPFNMPNIGGGNKLITGDFNGDGHSDLFVINYDWPTGAKASTFAVLLGNGLGNYTVSQNLTTTDYSFPGKPIVADFNRDGLDDIFIGTYGNELLQTGAADIILMGTASGVMREDRGLHSIMTWAHGSSLGDLNNDGYTDILNAGIGNLSSSAWLNDSKGRFVLSQTTLPSEFFPYFQTANVWSTLISDLNGDGLNDVVVGHSGGEYALRPYGYSGTGAPATIFYATAAGGWTSTTLPSGIFGVVNTDTVSIAQGDFDGDGRIDLLFSNYDKGAFVENGRVVYTGDANSGSSAGSFEAAGHTLTKAGMDNRELQLLLNKESGWVDASANILSGNVPTLHYLTSARAIDLDGDGDLDIAGTVVARLTAAATGPFIWLNDGKGKFSALPTLGFAPEVMSSVWDWSYTDVTGRGDWRMFASVTTDAIYPRVEIHLSAPLVQKVGIGGSTNDDYLHSDEQVTMPVFAYGGNDRLVFAGLSARADLGAGNDTITPGTGNATIDGGAGVDTVIYHGAKDGFVVTRTDGGFLVVDRSGVEGSDLLVGIEKLQLLDGQVDLTQAAPALAISSLGRFASGDKLLTGTAQSGATVHIFNGTQALGSTVADSTGVWKFSGADISGTGFGLAAESIDTRGMWSYRSDLFRFTAGSSGNDRIAVLAGNSLIDGKDGLDTLVVTSVASEFVVTKADGGFTLAARDGASTSLLVGVERILFADTALAFDIEGNGGQAYRVYQAAFARTPDLGGLGYWMRAMDSGYSLKTVAEGFVGSKEFKDLYGAFPTSTEIVAKFYENVLRRPGEEAGIKFWAGVLDTGSATIADVLMGFSESAENKVGLVGIMTNGFAYTPFA